jgi:hypothetical protein
VELESCKLSSLPHRRNFSGGRFHHGTRLLRWRPDTAPRQCMMDQVEKKRAHPFALFGAGARSR